MSSLLPMQDEQISNGSSRGNEPTRRHFRLHSSGAMRFVLLATIVFMLVAPATGCRTVDPALLTSDGQLLQTLEATPYRIAIAPVPYFEPPESPETALRFTLTPEQVRSTLMEHMAELNAASELFEVGTLDLFEARERNADLLLRIDWNQSDLAHEGFAGGSTVASGFLWFGTWVGSLFVPDSSYRTDVTLKCTLLNPHRGEPIREFFVRSGNVNLSFLERNPWGSSSLVLSWLVPPFLTPDTKDRTSAALSQHAMEQVAGHLTRFLKEDFQRQGGEITHIEITSPRNTAESPAAVLVDAFVDSPRALSKVEILVNGGRAATLVPDARSQHRFQIQQVVQLDAGRNEVQVRATCDSDAVSRTVIVHNSGQPGFDSLAPGAHDSVSESDSSSTDQAPAPTPNRNSPAGAKP